MTIQNQTFNRATLVALGFIFPISIILVGGWFPYDLTPYTDLVQVYWLVAYAAIILLNIVHVIQAMTSPYSFITYIKLKLDKPEVFEAYLVEKDLKANRSVIHLNAMAFSLLMVYNLVFAFYLLPLLLVVFWIWHLCEDYLVFD